MSRSLFILIVGCFATLLFARVHQFVAIDSDYRAELLSSQNPISIERLKSSESPSGLAGAAIRGDGWNWSLGVSGVALAGDFSNQTGETICIEFQNATVSTNHSVTERLWPTAGFMVIGAGKKQLLGQAQGSGPRVTPVEVCIPPRGSVWQAAYFDTADIAGGPLLFGAQPGPNLADSVKGRSMRLEIPIRFGARTDKIRLDITAKAAYMKSGTW
jgi:hypothetical protein